MSKTEEKEDRAKQQAAAQLSSIREMVAALDIETAAKAYVKDLTKTQCKKLLVGNTVKRPDEDEVEQWRETVVEAIVEFSIEPEDFEFDEEDARERIQEDPLSVEVRSGWCSNPSELKPEEYTILLCTGGPACRIIGDLSEHGDPETARIEYQDWFTPWVDYPLDSEEEADVVRYAQQFYFGQ